MQYMRITFATATGSVWIVNTEARSWWRPRNVASPFIRTTTGTYDIMSDVVIGEPVVFLTASGWGHLVSTSRVIAYEVE